MAVNLQDVICQRIEKEVVDPQSRSESDLFWPALLLDEQSLSVVTACCELYSNTFDRVTMVDELGYDDGKHPRLEAMYLISPCEKSIEQIKKDFCSSDNCRFKAAYVYFTYACPPMLLKELMEHPAQRFIKAVKVVNLSFVPYEPQVFSLDYPEACQINYSNKYSETCDAAVMERIAAQIVSLCVALGEFPRIRYRADRDSINAKLAVLVQQKLAAYEANEAGYREGSHTELLILDRGFDYVSPLLHELTLQAMAYDCMSLRNHFDRFEVNQLKNAKLKTNVFLKERYFSWKKLRHEHIFDAIKIIATRHKPPGLNDVNDRPMADVWHMIAQVPKYQSEIALTYSNYQVVDRCLSSYETKVEKLFNVEQELVVGTDITGEKLYNLMRKVDSILTDCNMSDYDKIRLILLLALTKKIAPENDLIKLSQLAGISYHECKSILSILARSGDHFGAGVTREMLGRSATENNDTEHASERSRWIPALKRVAEDAAKGNLDQKLFPVLTDSMQPSITNGETPACHDQSIRRVVILIVGGLTYSEMRSVYEVNAELKNCEVLVGGTHFLTPEGFIKDLKNFTNEQ